MILCLVMHGEAMRSMPLGDAVYETDTGSETFYSRISGFFRGFNAADENRHTLM